MIRKKDESVMTFSKRCQAQATPIQSGQRQRPGMSAFGEH
jgi:hypothetical protein